MDKRLCIMDCNNKNGLIFELCSYKEYNNNVVKYKINFGNYYERHKNYVRWQDLQRGGDLWNLK